MSSIPPPETPTPDPGGEGDPCRNVERQHGQRFLDAINIGDYVIDPYTEVEHTGVRVVDGTIIVEVKRPETWWTQDVALNGHQAMVVGGTGRILFRGPAIAQANEDGANQYSEGEVGATPDSEGELTPHTLGNYPVNPIVPQRSWWRMSLGGLPGTTDKIVVHNRDRIHHATYDFRVTSSGGIDQDGAMNAWQDDYIEGEMYNGIVDHPDLYGREVPIYRGVWRGHFMTHARPGYTPEFVSEFGMVSVRLSLNDGDGYVVVWDTHEHLLSAGSAINSTPSANLAVPGFMLNVENDSTMMKVESYFTLTEGVGSYAGWHFGLLSLHKDDEFDAGSP